MKGGQAALTLPVTDDMTGTMELHAYKILPNEDIVRDTRTIIVAPADDLSVSVDRRPGRIQARRRCHPALHRHRPVGQPRAGRIGAGDGG